MNIYLVSFEIDSEEDRDSMFHLLNSIGQALKIHAYATLLASELETFEIDKEIDEYHEYIDQWVVTKVDASFTGRSRDTERINRFLNNHNFRHLR